MKMETAKLPYDWPDIHLCYLANLGYELQNTEEYKSLVCESKYMCKHCGRVGIGKINMCQPVKL